MTMLRFTPEQVAQHQARIKGGPVAGLQPELSASAEAGGEDQEAQQFAAWWAAYAAEHGYAENLLVHIPNEGKRSPRVGAKLKRMGMRPGASDYVLFVPRGEHHGLLIELKTAGGRVQGNQVEFARIVTEQGYLCRITVGWQAAGLVVRRYLEVEAI